MTSPREASREHDPDEIPVPDVSGLVTEDGAPVDNLFSEKQMRLLTESLQTSWRPAGDRRFFLSANVGLFPTASNEPLVPDVLLALDTSPKQPFSEKKNRSYFIWEHGKPPDVVIEVVSNREGDELTRRLRGYERMRVSHYVVHDPWHLLSGATLVRFDISGGVLVEVPGPVFFPELGLGLTLWLGAYEHETAEWLRWSLGDGSLVATGAEAVESERQRAESERQRAESERQRAESERQRADRLAEKLRALGIEPD